MMSETGQTRQERVLRTLEHLRNRTTDLSAAVESVGPHEYVHPALATLERDEVFGRVPTIVAHGTEIPKPNDFMTVQMPRNQVLLARQKDGSVGAFVNLCRHRGALLQREPRGRARLFSCPYHRWSYDLDGSLRSVTLDDTFGCIDREKAGLVRLPVEERHGFIWLIDRAGENIDVAAWLGPQVDTIFTSYGLDSYVCAKAGSFAQPSNWKVMQDAFLDGYHIKFAHPNTASRYVHTNITVFEDFGRHSRFMAPRKSIDRWIDEDPGDLDLTRHVTENNFVLPNSSLLRQPDHFQLLTFIPDGNDPLCSRMEMRLIVPPVEESGLSAHEWEARWAKNWKVLLDVIIAEDFPIVSDSTAAMTSLDGGPLHLGRNEIANQHFRRELKRVLAGDR
jgi:phenylpropionate dioxygenase-like ring-hydroxylating dioxygenase large terminal subunit